MNFSGNVLAWLSRVPKPLLRALLGTSLWLSAVVLPRLYRGVLFSAPTLLLALSAIVVLALGTFLESRAHKGGEGLLLAGFPIAITLGMAGIDHDIALATYSPWVMIAIVQNLFAYMGVALSIASHKPAHREVEQKPLGEIAAIEPERRKQTLGTIVLASVCVGTVAILLFASWQTPAHYREHWGRSAPTGALLSALGAGLVGVAALAIVAPGLRAERGEVLTLEARARRVLWLCLVAVSGLAVYFLFNLSGL